MTYLVHPRSRTAISTEFKIREEAIPSVFLGATYEYLGAAIGVVGTRGMRTRLELMDKMEVAGLIGGSDFRSLRCLEDQIRFFRSDTKLPMELIASLLDTPVSTMHRYWHPKAQPDTSQATDTEAKAKYGPNSALTIKQEEQVLDWILRRQKEQNCPCPLEVCEYAARLKNDGQAPALHLKGHLSRDWWHKFKIRHKDVISVRVATSREQAHMRCTEKDVREYFSKMASILEKSKP